MFLACKPVENKKNRVTFGRILKDGWTECMLCSEHALMIGIYFCWTILSVKFTVIHTDKYESAMSTCLTRPALSCAPYSSPVLCTNCSATSGHWYPPFAEQSVFSDLRYFHFKLCRYSKI